jgi:hypothetical protein
MGREGKGREAIGWVEYSEGIGWVGSDRIQRGHWMDGIPVHRELITSGIVNGACKYCTVHDRDAHSIVYLTFPATSLAAHLPSTQPHFNLLASLLTTAG